MSQVGQMLIETIIDSDPAIRDRSARELARHASLAEKLEACHELEEFRRTRENLYERVRASLFLHALYRYEIQEDEAIRGAGLIPFSGFTHLMDRRYEQAIAELPGRDEPGWTQRHVASALARAYEQVAFQTLADQVRSSVRSCQGNRWMFRVGCADEHPLRIAPAAAGARARSWRSFRSWSSELRCGWISRTAAGRTSSFWEWTFPKARGC